MLSMKAKEKLRNPRNCKSVSFYRVVLCVPLSQNGRLLSFLKSLESRVICICKCFLISALDFRNDKLDLNVSQFNSALTLSYHFHLTLVTLCT